MIVRWIIEALLRPQVLNAIGGIVERVVAGQNAGLERRLEQRLELLEWRLEQRLELLESRVQQLELQGERRRAGDLPGKPPPLPGRQP